MNALEKAILAAGGASRLAKKISLSPMAISHWKKRHKGLIPSSHVLPVFQATGVTPHELRPDLYPNPTDGLPVETKPCNR
ncbi:helix-turn-helix domain-containing protein [Pluralibacter gergoviae]|uniref:Helix-turn-helix domain-containing protein n=1 Tax=Pluralibacter gergoviae TaxID=61647 RepID=A0AAI9DGI9_PLUGE|nr:YdaS family helix-turn-helix protein [Pluralibacter gergoviae]AVR03736.1 Rha family transcriptional regulator [Pluralibacter gergoviae]EKV0913256.1 helix-turn-helix domain-containing protein [Pluralibacter gergoviae]EKV9907929.1 helix-turn-helix domain-containing protein [Pluralibacter gergoviae]EKW6617740.1 helix-turn-helix domain-containing protein [Pluralibacter gergoviae]EKW7272491.1 helix-turn-helix domain-containing protein [Pluralibacter gergoviae]